MLYNLLEFESLGKARYFLIVLAAFCMTIVNVKQLSGMLPRDQGRPNAVNGELSKGKPRGAGLIVISSFTLCCALFVPLSLEYVFYLALIYASMITGFLDDSAKMPWGPTKKGLLDAAISIGAAVVYYLYNGSKISLGLFGISFELPAAVFVILAAVLVWASINVTNCSDGVDGLCAVLSIISLLSFGVLIKLLGSDGGFCMIIAVMAASLLAYLWFNCSPSQLLMGDAGSRAIGVCLAVAAMKSSAPIMFVPFCAVLIADGGCGLVKLGVRRAFKAKKFMDGLRTPVHDHFRKTEKFEWSDTQVVIRFAIVQTVISVLFLTVVK